MAVKDTNTRVAVTLEKDVLDELKRVAKADNRTVSNFVANVVIEHLKFLKKKNKKK